MKNNKKLTKLISIFSLALIFLFYQTSFSQSVFITTQKERLQAVTERIESLIIIAHEYERSDIVLILEDVLSTAEVISRKIEEQEKYTLLVSCLKEKEVVIFGSKTCPKSNVLVESFTGASIISPIYIECSNERNKCISEKKTPFVPETQKSGSVYYGDSTPKDIAIWAGCSF